ncbi:MAG: response regulator [Candidatus Omnitrophota bacterium]|nr:response regulator [Candidatus Omnitrophota bacterium]
MSKSILVVDDDKLVLGSVSNLFIKNGWRVNACSSGKEGLKQLAIDHYDCILLDIKMPDLDGTQVLERLRSLECERKIDHQRVIIMTGFADEEASVKAFQLGAFNYINKPFEIEDVLQKAEECANSKSVSQTFESPPTEESEEMVLKKIRKSYEPADVQKKASILSKKLNVPLQHIKGCTYDTNHFKGNIENPIGIVQIPLGLIGPLAINGNHAKGDFWVPLATSEGALSLTYDLGARLLRMSGPVEVEIISKGVHIAPMFPLVGDNGQLISEFVDKSYNEIKKVAEGASNHTKLLRIEKKKTANNFLLKFVYDTGDAQGLNMINQACFNACKYIQAKTGFRFYHRSHYSGIKHFSPLNEREGQGRKVKASAIISSKALGMLKVKADQMKDFFDRCIECAHAAGISSVNVHAANGVTAIFLACGQDMADISCSHSAATAVEIIDGKDLKIDVVLNNLMVATVGGGTGLGTQRECMEIMGCLGTGKSDKFAEIIAATVLAGEFPTAAAVITETYVDIHNKYGRNRNKLVC